MRVFRTDGFQGLKSLGFRVFQGLGLIAFSWSSLWGFGPEKV